MNNLIVIALLLLSAFLFIEGGRRALALSFKWIDFIEGLLLVVAGLVGIAGLLTR